MTMENPPHPGEVLKHQFVEDEDGNQINTYTEAAKSLGIGPFLVKLLCKKIICITPEIAKTLENNDKGSAEMWISMQIAYNLWSLNNDN